MITAALLLAAAAPAPFACGAVTRPGVAELGADGVWRGRAVDLCRATAERAHGPGAPIRFHSYDGVSGLRSAAADRIAFLSPDELVLVPGFKTGPAVIVARQVLAVKTDAPTATARELAGRLVCFIVGTRAEEALNAWADRTGVAVERLAFQEPDEMRDAVEVGKCAAAAVDAADADAGALRPLEPPLAETPILLATPAASSEAWRRSAAAVVGDGGTVR